MSKTTDAGQQPPGQAGTTIGKRRGRPPKERAPGADVTSKLESRLNPAELSRQLASVFNLLSRLARSERRFVASDCAPMSDAMIDSVNLFPPLRIIFRVFGPLVAVGEALQKVAQIMEGRPAKPTPAPPVPTVVPDGVNPYPPQRGVPNIPFGGKFRR